MAAQDRDRPALTSVLLIGSEAFDRFAPVLRRLVVGLMEHAVQLRVVSSDPRVDELQLGPVQVHQHAPVHGFFRQRRLRRLAEALAPAPTILHAVSGETYREACELAELLDSELILQASSRADCAEALELQATNDAWFLPMSRPLEALLRQRLTLGNERVQLVRPGVLATREQATFEPSEESATVFCTTPFVAAGCVDQLLEATAMLRKRGRRVMLFLAGEGPLESQLRRTVRMHDLSASVTFAQPAGDLTPALQSADLFAEPSMDGTIVLDTLEAMAAGVLVASAPNAISDHLIDGETAVMSRAVTADALADCMERALFEDGLGAKVAQGGLEHVRFHHTVTGMALAVADLYRRAGHSRATFPIREA